MKGLCLSTPEAGSDPAGVCTSRCASSAHRPVQPAVCNLPAPNG
ncbi:hypothetical protein D3OALGA1CA_4852 [Olavius algarvensis associated proteobacterium Delta 3]|nr:hypothetical protein D3OALGB2SA_707 [Olavius algarvensis associated proteobacterium Delta 3]CAB5157888.1 hypothetical protein D3OALGA1CA_4852 [Olavius algarvensis associated proteobacterium Delta 3]